MQIVGRRLGPEDGLLIIGRDGVGDGVMYSAFQHYLSRGAGGDGGGSGAFGCGDAGTAVALSAGLDHLELGAKV